MDGNRDDMCNGVDSLKGLVWHKEKFSVVV